MKDSNFDLFSFPNIAHAERAAGGPLGDQEIVMVPVPRSRLEVVYAVLGRTRGGRAALGTGRLEAAARLGLGRA